MDTSIYIILLDGKNYGYCDTEEEAKSFVEILAKKRGKLLKKPYNKILYDYSDKSIIVNVQNGGIIFGKHVAHEAANIRYESVNKVK
uniref:Uncharacterized protein n=1 Tax=Pithovirus LCPAC403 TaxID=2506596 RepID=A0A481ZEV9_9VIRU|nr:MAG: hypothetical protein LCPAC403_02550 [Pithovirus LCPAC403]